MKRGGGRRIISWIAIAAIALQAMLWGVAAPMAAASAVDPFSVICHSETQATFPADQTPAAPAPSHSQACDHCNLCNAAPTALGTLNGLIAFYLTPARLLHVMLPAPDIAPHGNASNPKRARGPPIFV